VANFSFVKVDPRARDLARQHVFFSLARYFARRFAPQI